MNTRHYWKVLVLLAVTIALVLINLPRIASAQESLVLLANVNDDVSALNVRSGPGYEYPILRQIPGSWQLGLIGRTASAAWFQIQSYDGMTVEWVDASYVTSYQDVMTLPVTGGDATTPTNPTTCCAQPVAPVQDMVLLATVKNDVSALNVRSGPGYGYPVLRQRPGGWQIGLIGRNADASWFQIQPQDGVSVEWVDASYVTSYRDVMALPITGSDATIPPQDTVLLAHVNHDVSALNVRSGPGYEYPVLRQRPGGWQIGLVGRNADASWFQIQPQDGVSVEWVDASYVTSYRDVMTLSVTSQTAPATRTHTVMRGETVYSIARRYGVDVQSLITLNQLTNPNHILVGQVLLIP